MAYSSSTRYLKEPNINLENTVANTDKIMSLLQGDPLTNARNIAEEQELTAMSVNGLSLSIAGIELKPLTPGRLLMLELVDSSVIKAKPSIDYIAETIKALYILTQDRDKFGIITSTVSRRRAYLDSLAIIKAGEDPKTGVMFQLTTDADKVWNDTLVEFADGLELLDIIESYQEIVSYIDNSLAIYKMCKKKAVKK